MVTDEELFAEYMHARMVSVFSSKPEVSSHAVGVLDLIRKARALGRVEGRIQAYDRAEEMCSQRAASHAKAAKISGEYQPNMIREGEADFCRSAIHRMRK